MGKIEDRLGKLESRVGCFTAFAVLALIGIVGALAFEKLPQDLAQAASEQKGHGELRVESGTLTIKSDRIRELEKFDGCAGHRGAKKQIVRFVQSFSNPPQMVLGLSTFDLVSTGADLRIWLSLDEVRRDSFVYTFTTWCDTALSLAKANWMAIGR